MNKTYLIVGASSDVGCELLSILNNTTENSVFIAHYRSSSAKIQSIKMRNDNRIIMVQADLSKEESVRKFVEEINSFKLIPDAIVHLPAPKLEYVKFKDIKWGDCAEDSFVQVASIMMILQEFLPRMVKKEGHSKVVFILSENTIVLPAKFTSKYTMSKYMLLGLMNSLVAEYQGKRVNINAISPSMIDTKLLSNIDRRLLEASGATENLLSPEDVAIEICKLFSEESDEINGKNIYIPGRSSEK